jgi:hypothetical protein
MCLGANAEQIDPEVVREAREVHLPSGAHLVSSVSLHDHDVPAVAVKPLPRFRRGSLFALRGVINYGPVCPGDVYQSSFLPIGRHASPQGVEPASSVIPVDRLLGLSGSQKVGQLLRLESRYSEDRAYLLQVRVDGGKGVPLIVGGRRSAKCSGWSFGRT